MLSDAIKNAATKLVLKGIIKRDNEYTSATKDFGASLFSKILSMRPFNSRYKYLISYDAYLHPQIIKHIRRALHIYGNNHFPTYGKWLKLMTAHASSKKSSTRKSYVPSRFNGSWHGQNHGENVIAKFGRSGDYIKSPRYTGYIKPHYWTDGFYGGSFYQMGIIDHGKTLVFNGETKNGIQAAWYLHKATKKAKYINSIPKSIQGDYVSRDYIRGRIRHGERGYIIFKGNRMYMMYRGASDPNGLKYIKSRYLGHNKYYIRGLNEDVTSSNHYSSLIVMKNGHGISIRYINNPDSTKHIEHEFINGYYKRSCNTHPFRQLVGEL